MLEIGIKGTKEIVVTEDVTAKKFASGALEVYATPAMIALIEDTAFSSIQDQLEEGQGTVGINVNVSHLAATPMGMKVRCETELIDIDRKRLVFHAVVYDEIEKIGEGTHERFIIDNDKFLERINAKAK